MVNERWKDVVGYEGLYQVSDRGRVKSLSRLLNNNRQWQNRILKPAIRDKSGHFGVSLCKNGKGKTYCVHQLVLVAFVGFCPDNMEGCHNNGIKTDNRLSNLRYDTHSNNILDSVKHGTHVDSRGEKHGLSKLTEQQVKEIRKLAISSKYTPKMIAEIFGISQCTVSDIKLGKRWGWLK